MIVLAWIGAARSLDSQFSPLAKQELEKEKREKARVKEATVEVPVEVKAIENSGNGAALKQTLDTESESSSGASSPQVQ